MTKDTGNILLHYDPVIPRSLHMADERKPLYQ